MVLIEKRPCNFYLDRGPKGEKRGKFPLVQMREKDVKFSLEVPFERSKETSPFLYKLLKYN